MQICPRHPSDTVAWMLQLFDRLRHRLLDLLVQPDCDERAHSFGFAIPEVVAQMRWCLIFRPTHYSILLEIKLSRPILRPRPRRLLPPVHARPEAADRCRRTSTPRRTSLD